MLKKITIMKNKNIFVKFLILLLATSTLLFTAGCSKDEYADLNTDPSTIGKGNIPYLLTQAMANYQPFDYLLWFYDARYTSRFIQAYTPSGSFGDLFNQMNELGGLGSQFINVRIYEKEIADMISQMSEEEGAKYASIQCMANVLSISLAINDSDLYGSMPYSETVQLRYGGTLTPKYDTQEELFNTWLEELDNDINTFATAEDQIQAGSNDLTYGGDLTKWTKFANGLKLKIAVRLLHQNKDKALQIAQEVGSSDSNIMSGLTDDYIFNRSTDANNGDYTYQTGNSYGLGAASKNVIDFMKKNEDPRMLVMFTKNSFNEEVIQAFFDAQANGDDRCAVPQYILDNVEYTTDADGKKTFVSWKGQGEPWVRYYGIPIGINLDDDTLYTGNYNYFVSTRWEVTVGESSKTYAPYSSFNEELTRGRCDFTFPTKPDGRTIQDTDDVPWWGMTMSTGEMNLYLAEFKLLGASLPKTAQEYFEAGVRASAEEYNQLATLNQIPYYSEDQCYDGLGDEPITYGDDEINQMLTHSDYTLTGDVTSDLEKVYIQEYLHFYYLPVDQFVTARRSGVPKVGSSLIPWITLKESNQIPRRLYSVAPTEEDKMKDQVEAAFAEQGFTFCDGTHPEILSTERVWYDKNAPEFGAGPNY
jgi:hypothetical protein